MRKFLLLGLLILVLFGGALALVWHLEGADAGPVAAPSVLEDARLAPAPLEAGAPAQAGPEVPPAPPDQPSVLRPRRASDRDPRNDVQRPADPRADLMVQERAAIKASAIDQLNRRTARRKAEMEASGEVRPSAPPPHGSKP